MSHYLVQFGHSPQLARLELATYLARTSTKYQQHTLTPSLHLIDTKIQLDPQHLVDSLGGVVRIAEELRQADSQYLPQALTALLASSGSKTTFSISSLDPNLDPSPLMSTVKIKLKDQDINSRFIAASKGFLAPIQIRSQHVTELILVPQSSSQYRIFQTQAVTDYHSWVARDRHRPSVDPQSGMLPPKIARILVNLGLNHSINSDTLVYDPFCGSGTILAEALTIGASVIGSDIDSVAVNHSRQNLDWLTQTFKTDGSYHLFTADAITVSPDNLPSPASAIVTEVDLGPATHQSPEEVVVTISRLQTLYQKALPHLKSLLKPTGRLVIALPKHRSAASVKMLESLVDTCENSGYTLISGPLVYSQPHARVQRAIYIFENH